MSTKSCRTCYVEKDVTEFHLSRHKTPETQCKACKHSAQRERRALQNDSEIREKRNAKQRERWAAMSDEERTARNRKSYDRVKRRFWSMKGKYGLSKQQFDALWDSQDGSCGSCKVRFVLEDVRPFAVDHDHETGQVRGLLCNPCNLALGLLYEDEDKILGLLGYLRSVR